MLRILFLSNQPPGNHSAYNTRLDGLRLGLESLGVETGLASLRAMRFSRPHLLFPLNAPHIARVARGYDAIHAGGTGVALAACAARIWGGPPVVYDVHGDEVQETRLAWQMERSPRALYAALQARLISPPALWCADHLLMVSQTFFARYRDEKGVNPARLSLALNGVDTRDFQPASHYTPDHNGVTNIAYAGSFQSWQAIDQLVAAFQQITHENVHFHLLGFHPQREADQTLKATITAMLGHRVTCTDWISKPELIARLQLMDVLVIPRTTNPAMRGGLPSKFAEFLALGKPLIVTNVDDTANYVSTYHCGLVCEPQAGSMATALHTLLAMPPPERAWFGANARRLAEDVFDWRVIAAGYLTTLRERVISTGDNNDEQPHTAAAG